MDHRRVPFSCTIAFILIRKTKAMALSGTHPWPCNYHNMRGIAETAGTWSDMLALLDVLHELPMCKAGYC